MNLVISVQGDGNSIMELTWIWPVKSNKIDVCLIGNGDVIVENCRQVDKNIRWFYEHDQLAIKVNDGALNERE